LMRLALALSRKSLSAAVVTKAGKGDVGLADAVKPSESRKLTPRPKVVIADDDPIIVTVVESTLRNYGMQCRAARNGQDALRAIREEKPHVAVLDINMPGMDGFEVLAAIRGQKIPTAVVLLSARQQERDILRAFQLGADDYLVKPFNPLEL